MTGQDWLEKDFYSVLGVPKDADAATIKKAYRKLAREKHPDHNPGNPRAEAEFKDIGEAYSVLSDAEQRQQYDQLRAMAGGARFTAGGRGGGGGFEDILGGMFGGGGSRVRYSSGGAGGFEDILGGMFGGGFQRGPQPGADVATAVELPFRQAVEGSTVSLQVGGRTVNARIPAGVRDGQKIRLRGKGRPGEPGAPAGDLVVTVHVTPHPVFSLDGRNLKVTVPVAFDEAALGATIEVPTLGGEPVRVKVPAGTPSGRTLRVKGKGVPASGSAKTPGDLMVTVQVVVPQRLSDAAREAVQAFGIATSGEDPRASLMEQART